MRQINWGVIGPGSIARAFAYSIQGTTNSKLTSVFGRNPQKTDSFASKFQLNAHHRLSDFISSKETDATHGLSFLSAAPLQ